MAKDSPKKSSPSNKSKGSPEKKGSPDKKKGSPDKKKGAKEDEQQEEQIIEIPLPVGVMHKKLRTIYDDEIKYDINFIVGPEGATKTFKIHKCILVAESPIFQKLMNDIENFKIENAKILDDEEWEKIKQTRPVPPDPEDETSDQEFSTAVPDKKGKKGSKKDSPDKKSSPKKGSPKKDSPKKESPKKDSPSKKKGSPEKSGSKKEGKGKGKGSPSKKDSPKSKKGSPGKAGGPEVVTQEEINILIDTVVDDNTIRVQDVHPDGFYRLMRYAYYDEIVFNGVIGTIRTLYAGRKYLFYDLSRACVIYLENNVTLKHVLRLLKASLDFHEDKLKQLSLDLIINKTFEVINQPAFIQITKDMITLILEQDILNIREIELFDRVAHWAENRCEDLGIAVTAANQRIALGPYTMSLIRFPTILPHEFAVHIVENGILRSDELIEIMSYFITGHKPNVPYSLVTRRRPFTHPLPDMEAYSIVHSNVTDITFVDISRDMKLRYATSLDDLDRSKKYPNMYDPCEDQPKKPEKTVTQVSDFPLYINKRTYRTTSLKHNLNADNFELQLIHYKLHPQSCRNFFKERWYIDHKDKDLTVLDFLRRKPRYENIHWDTTLIY